MATAKNKSDTETVERFGKSQFLRSKKYINLVDFLKVWLEDDKTYTKSEVEEIINKHMKGSVK